VAIAAAGAALSLVASVLFVKRCAEGERGRRLDSWSRAVSDRPECGRTFDSIGRMHIWRPEAFRTEVGELPTMTGERLFTCGCSDSGILEGQNAALRLSFAPCRWRDAAGRCPLLRTNREYRSLFSQLKALQEPRSVHLPRSPVLLPS
jgi:hypothetical protein